MYKSISDAIQLLKAALPQFRSCSGKLYDDMMESATGGSSSKSYPLARITACHIFRLCSTLEILFSSDCQLFFARNGTSLGKPIENAPVNMDGSIRTIKSHSPDMKDMINKDKYKDDKGNNINHRASPINVNDDINGRGLVRINDGKRGISFGPSDDVDDIDNMKLLHKGSGSPRRGVLRSRGGELDKRSTTPNKTLAPGGIIVLDQPKSKKVISINPSDLDDYSDINENNNIDGIKRRPKKHKVQF